MSQLAERLRQEIARRGPIPFSEFMRLALYCPEIGYYERATVGRRGDFYTNVSVGPLFGQLLAFQFAEWLEQLPVDRVQVVEAGAHDGTLAKDILTWLRHRRPTLSARLDYWILEPSARRQNWQRKTLEHFAGRVSWFSEWKSIPAEGVMGIVFSNELLDAFPVRRFGWEAKEYRWFEWGVDNHAGQFSWTRLTTGTASLPSELQSTSLDLSDALLALLPDGFTIEVAPEAVSWWCQAATTLCGGKLLTLDYGVTSEEWIRPERTNGTLRAYRKHAIAPDPLADPGEQDLTAHVNFTSLQRAGEAAGLRTEALLSQPQFLTRNAERIWLELPPGQTWLAEQTRQFQTLTHLDHLGRAFRVLVQGR